MDARRIHILVVEDHRDTLEVLARLLQMDGFTVAAVSHPSQAIEAARRQHFDAIVTDIHMPEMNGVEMLARIRAYSSAPALAVSALGMADDIKDAMSNGFAEYILKPVALITVVAAIHRVLKNHRGHPDELSPIPTPPVPPPGGSANP